MTAPPSPTTTRKNTSAASPSTPACCTSTYKGKHLHLLDTPGYPDFVGAALGALTAVETVIVVVSAVNGVQVNTRRMFAEAGRRGAARMLVINKLDGDNIKFPELLKIIQDTFGKACVLFNAPISPGPKLSGVVSVLNPPASTPAGCPVDLVAAKAQAVECIVECDEELTMKYLESGVSDEEIADVLPRAIAAGTVIPIFCTAAKKDIGIAELLDALCADALSPIQGRKRTALKGQGDSAAEVALEPDPNAEFVGQVFKTLTDKFVGNLSFIRVYSGTYKPDQPLFNVRTRQVGPHRRSVADAGQDVEAGARGRAPATSSPSPRSRTCTSATPSATTPARRSCRP